MLITLYARLEKFHSVLLVKKKYSFAASVFKQIIVVILIMFEECLASYGSEFVVFPSSASREISLGVFEVSWPRELGELRHEQRNPCFFRTRTRAFFT
jgi:hypothetical protein